MKKKKKKKKEERKKECDTIMSFADANLIEQIRIPHTYC